jgi:hypothetical protein
LPEPYAAFTIAGPPVAIVRSQLAINSFARGMLGFSTHCKRSSGAPCLRSAARIRRTVSIVVFRLAG